MRDTDIYGYLRILTVWLGLWLWQHNFETTAVTDIYGSLLITTVVFWTSINWQSITDVDNSKNEAKEVRHTTIGFVQLRLEVVAINISNMAAFVRAWQTSPKIGSYYLTLSKAKQRCRADGMLMPQLHKAWTLAANLI